MNRAIQALATLQRPTGEWPTEWSMSITMDAAQEHPTSPYLTGFVVHVLALLEATPQLQQLLAHAKQFLLNTQSPQGTWNYEGPTGTRVPDDFDDTSVASAALLLLEHRPRFETYRMLWENEVAPGGPYYTWLNVNTGDSDLARLVDVLVNANIAWFAGLAGLNLPNLAAYLAQAIATEAYVGEQARYSISPHISIYALSRAAFHGRMAGLESITQTTADFVLNQLAPTTSAFELACCCITLLNANSTEQTITPYLEPLLAAQQADGTWAAWGAWKGFRGAYDGGAALSTALALEALWKWHQRINPPTPDAAAV